MITKTEVRSNWSIFGFVSNPDYFEGRYVEYMKTIDIHLTDEQYEKLQILQKHAGYDNPEEAADEFFSTALLAVWDNYKSKAVSDM